MRKRARDLLRRDELQRMRPDAETHAAREQVLVPERLPIVAKHGRANPLRDNDILDRDDDRGDAAHAVPMPVLPRYALCPRGLVFDQERRAERVRRSRLRRRPNPKPRRPRPRLEQIDQRHTS